MKKSISGQYDNFDNFSLYKIEKPRLCYNGQKSNNFYKRSIKSSRN